MNKELEILRRELEEARETNKRLNREKQRLEAAVAEKAKSAFGSLGRALANARCQQLEERVKELEQQLYAKNVQLKAAPLKWVDVVDGAVMRAGPFKILYTDSGYSIPSVYRGEFLDNYFSLDSAKAACQRHADELLQFLLTVGDWNPNQKFNCPCGVL